MKKMKKKIKPSKVILEEQSYERMLAESGWENTLTEKRKEEIEEAAKAQVEKRKKESRVNLRLDNRDVERFRLLAEREGLGYQTLMTSILHKYAEGNLVDKILLDQLAQSMKKAVWNP